MRFIDSILDIESASWQALLCSSKYASYFQSKECYDLYAKTSFLEPFVFAVEDNGELKALLCGYITKEVGKIRGFFSRRAIVPAGVLIANDCSNEALTLLLNSTILSLKSKAIYIEIRNYNDYSTYTSVFESCRFYYQEHLDVQVDTSSDPYKRLHSSKQRQVSSAIQEGLTYRIATKEDISDWYSLLSELYSKKIHLPLFPQEFFEHAIEQEHIDLIVVEQDNKIIGGMLIPILYNRIAYEWFVCGNVMSTYAGLDYVYKRGIGLFDFMGAGTLRKQYGVRDFKLSMGGEQKEFGRYLYQCNRFLYKIGEFAISLKL